MPHHGSFTTTKPLAIGSIALDSPFVQAALSGYSDWAMRALARRYGAAYSVAEVMLDRFALDVKGTGKTEHYLYVADEDHPVGAQLMGADPENFAPAALRLVAAGFDVIDVNFGCPVKTAMGGCRGGYHLSQPRVAKEILQRVRDAVPAEIPVTVKLRRGIDDSPASRDRFFEILEFARHYGLAAATVHGRTVEQKYVGPSNWDFLREVKQFAGDFVILGSGDLFAAEDCLAMLSQTGVDGVTIARGAIGNPWIFQQCLALWQGETYSLPSLAEQKATILEHLELSCARLGTDKGWGVLKKFSFKYARFHPQELELIKAFQQVRSRMEFENVLQAYYSA